LLLFYFFFCLDTKEAKNQGFANKKLKATSKIGRALSRSLCKLTFHAPLPIFSLLFTLFLRRPYKRKYLFYFCFASSAKASGRLLAPHEKSS
jgi:hypothetical protein